VPEEQTDESSAPVDDPWAMLGLRVGAGEAEIRGAYREALRAHPPEADAEGFKRLRAAYEALRDPERRGQLVIRNALLLPDLPAVEARALCARPVEPPTPAELLADLRALLLAGGELARTDFSADLRPVPE